MGDLYQELKEYYNDELYSERNDLRQSQTVETNNTLGTIQKTLNDVDQSFSKFDQLLQMVNAKADETISVLKLKKYRYSNWLYICYHWFQLLV